MIVLNVFCMFLSAWVASTCEQWTFVWWLNIFASALNAAAVLITLVGWMS